jgi:hypothetical protein
MAALLAHGLVDNTLFFPDLALAFFLMLALVQWGKESRGRPFRFCQVSRKSVE